MPIIREVGRKVPLDLTKRLGRFDPTLVVSGGLSVPVSGRIALWARRRHIPFGVWSGETLSTASQRSRVRLLGRRRIAHAASFAMTYGSASGEYLRYLNPGLPVVHARNSTLYREPFDAAPDGTDDPVSILTVGRAFPGKNLDIPVRALLERPKLKCVLTVVGDGPELPAIRELARDDPRIRVLGAVPSTDVLKYFEHADGFVFPSRIDVFGLVLVEALGTGVATIVNRSAGAVADLAVDHHNCLVVDSDDLRDWATSLEQLVIDGTSGGVSRGPAHRQSRGAGRSSTPFDAFVAGLRLGTTLQGRAA